ESMSSFSSKEDTCHIHGDGHRNCVSLVPIFNHLESSQMDDIMTVVQHRTFKKGEMLYHADEKADALYIVHQGLVKIYRLSESGKEQLVRILKSGDFTGELAIFQDDVQETFAEAIQDTNICVIYRDDLQRFLLKYPTVSLKLLQDFSHRLDTSEKQTMQFATEKVELRIAHFLVENLSEDNEDTNCGEVELPMSKRDLASYLGTTPETLSRRLTDLEETGLSQQKGQRFNQVLDADALLLIYFNQMIPWLIYEYNKNSMKMLIICLLTYTE